MFKLEIQDHNNEIYNFLVTKDVYDLAYSGKYCNNVIAVAKLS